MLERGTGLLAALVLAATQAGAQALDQVARDRAEFASWLATAPDSPLRAIGQYPVTGPLTLGPAGSDVPLEGVTPQRLTPGNGATAVLLRGAERTVVARGRPVPIGAYHLVVGGLPGRLVATFYRAAARPHVPAYYPIDPAWRLTTVLEPSSAGKTLRVLGSDGTEVEATEAGSIQVSVGGRTYPLRVLRLPVAGTEESELEIYFQDGTNDRGTYPAGRFVTLTPAGGSRYVVDFNTARNPFCAYNGAFPCPAPWRGNLLPISVPAGEKYAGTQTTTPAASPP